MDTTIFLFVIGLLATIVRAKENATLQFPAGFKLGVASAAYQVEGAWDVSDKAVSVWDNITHRSPSPITDGSNADVACDSYHKYKEDVALLKDLGVDTYRLSLSWARILPTGFPDQVSTDGLQYYKNLLDELHAQGIEPVVTIYHWDHPLVLEEMGGWLNESMVTWFADYARFVFEELGDRIKIYSTINEPTIICDKLYDSGSDLQGKPLPSNGKYVCTHNLLKAHAKAYRIYDSEFRKAQGGQVGIAILCKYNYPKNSNDTIAAVIENAFDFGWISDPIFSETGDYPAILKVKVAEASASEGEPKSKLPVFTQAEIDEIRGSSDFFGLNHYSSSLATQDPTPHATESDEDSGVVLSSNSSWGHTAREEMRIVPEGFGDILRLVKKRYNNPPIFVLENGMSDDGSIDDQKRIQFLHDYIRELLIAMNVDGCNVIGYILWSLMDNFEWDDGYTLPFGLVNVDFKDPSRPRKPKSSFNWYKELIRSRALPPVCVSNKIKNQLASGLLG